MLLVSTEFLSQSGDASKGGTSERALSALNISMATRTDRDSVDALALPSWKKPQGLSKEMTLLPAV